MALRIDEVALALGVSPDFFQEHILPHLRTVTSGKGSRRIKLIPVREIERWLEANSSRVLDDFLASQGALAGTRP